MVFDAVVQSYTDRVSGKKNYCLGNAGELTILHSLALTIPDPPQEDVAKKRLDPPPVPAPKSQVNSIETIRVITTWAKSAGGLDTVEKVLAEMPSLPVPVLLEYVRAMKE